MAVARTMLHGCDVWLNNPRRPFEACGTSGMKAALNGVLNCSILDGWWDECYDGSNGWAIASADDDADIERRDQREATSLFGLLEREIVPLFYDRDIDGVPVEWIDKMKDNWCSLGPFVTAARMVRDYTSAAVRAGGRERCERCSTTTRARGRGAGPLEAACQRDRGPTSRSSISTSTPSAAHEGDAASCAGSRRTRWPRSTTARCTVQALHGPIDSAGVVHRDAGDRRRCVADGTGTLRGHLRCRRGRAATASQCVPFRTIADLISPMEMGLVAWADVAHGSTSR